MPRYDSYRRRRRDWFEPDQPAGEGQTAPADWPDDVRQRMEQFRPPWWPENEPFPPRRRWRRKPHRPFFRRLGCIFLLFNVMGALGLAALVLAGVNALGIAHVPLTQFRWVFATGGILLGVMISLVFLTASNLRGVSIPLDDLLSAAGQVAEGDYTVRVAENGPPEVRSLAAAFNSMSEKLQSHEQQRRAMLADVTHELRTPLTIIQGNLEALLDGMYPADPARLKSMLEETQILSRLTDDLRTLSQAESGSLELRREHTDLVALVRQTVEAFQSQASEAGVTIEPSMPAAELLLDIDAERIRQVLSNLISNAIRYSPRGSSVRVELLPDSAAPGAGAHVSVADSGPGIATTDLPHVFDRYYKSADSHGMGLGLSIARYIVQAHGGEIRAESGPGKGTTISFTLPG